MILHFHEPTTFNKVLCDAGIDQDFREMIYSSFGDDNIDFNYKKSEKRVNTCVLGPGVIGEPKLFMSQI